MFMYIVCDTDGSEAMPYSILAMLHYVRLY
jgi:hypothetical protein